MAYNPTTGRHETQAIRAARRDGEPQSLETHSPYPIAVTAPGYIWQHLALIVRKYELDGGEVDPRVRKLVEGFYPYHMYDNQGKERAYYEPNWRTENFNVE